MQAVEYLNMQIRWRRSSFPTDADADVRRILCPSSLNFFFGLFFWPFFFGVGSGKGGGVGSSLVRHLFLFFLRRCLFLRRRIRRRSTTQKKKKKIPKRKRDDEIDAGDRIIVDVDRCFATPVASWWISFCAVVMGLGFSGFFDVSHRFFSISRPPKKKEKKEKRKKRKKGRFPEGVCSSDELLLLLLLQLLLLLRVGI